MIAGGGGDRAQKPSQTWMDRTGGATRGSIVPWQTLPPGPAGYITLNPQGPGAVRSKWSKSFTAETDMPSWAHRTGPLSLRGQHQPNIGMRVARSGEPPGPPLAVSEHGPEAKKKVVLNTSTAKNDRNSWEQRLQGGALKGTDAPWDSMRHFVPAPGVPHGSDYALGRPPVISNSSTAATDVASWHNRFDGPAAKAGLRGQRCPNTILRVATAPSPSLRRSDGLRRANDDLDLASTGGHYDRRAASLHDTSTAANDVPSWHRRATGGGGGGAAATGTRGQQYPFAQNLNESGARAGDGRSVGSEYQTWHKAKTTTSSTATVDKHSWEERINRTCPDLQAAFKSTRGQPNLSTYINQGYGFTGRSM